MTDLGVPRPVGKYALLRLLDEPSPHGGRDAEHFGSPASPAISGLTPPLPPVPRVADPIPEAALYLAAEAAADKPRAVLVLPVAASSRPDLEGARQLCGLVHPNLLQVLDAGRTDSELFIASEWLVGCDLAALLVRVAQKSARIPIATALYLVREVARGLHAEHTHGGPLVAHGAVAPSNILCGHGGEVKLLNRERLEQLLGGALPSGPHSETGVPRPVLPPPRVRSYQAADQAWGAAPTRRGDVYALGAVLWELLTQRRLHEDDPALIGLELVTGGPPSRPLPTQLGHFEGDADPLDVTVPQPGVLVPPSAYVREVPASVDALVLRALDPRPEERFASAEELRQALSRELARLAPELTDSESGCVAALLRDVLGDELAHKCAEHEWLLESARELWARSRPPSGGRATGEAPRPTWPERSSPLPSMAGITIPPELAKTQPGPTRRLVQSPEERLDREQLIDGRYRLRRLIGVGGMGAVYEAEHTAILKRVALKILHPQFSQHPDLIERLRREAQAASRIGHPNIVDVTDFGRTDDGSAYLAMEYLHGTDLGAILRARGRLAEPRTLHIGVQLVRALAAAHRVGIIHRDLKPENVFLVDPIDWTEAEGARIEFEGVPSLGQDLVKVLDFGIAMQQAESVVRPLPRAARLTSPGLTVGTPEYMAPEQAMGLKVDPRADIYAVGTMLYEMLCARVPFIAASVPELLTFKTGQDAPPPHLWLPAISPPFEALILRCLARDPSARPQSMEELERELLRVASEQGIVLDPMRSGAMSSRAYLKNERQNERQNERLTGGAPTSGGRPAARSTPPVSAGPSGRTAGAASADSGSRLRPLDRVTDLYGGSGGEQLTTTVAGSSVTVPPRWTARWRQLMVGGVLAVGMVIIGFSSAHLVPRRGHPEPSPSRPVLPVAGVESVPVVAVRPSSQGFTVTAEPVEPALKPHDPSSLSESHSTMLTEWARRAAAAGRYTTPPGDNLVELLKRGEATAVDKTELAQLREQAAATLNKKARDQLRKRHTLAALESYHSLMALSPGAPFPRPELAVQLAAIARVIHREQALALAQTAVELAPKLAVAHLALGDVLLGQGNRQAAAIEYRRTLNLFPESSVHRQALRGLARTAAVSTPARPPARR